MFVFPHISLAIKNTAKHLMKEKNLKTFLQETVFAKKSFPDVLRYTIRANPVPSNIFQDGFEPHTH